MPAKIEDVVILNSNNIYNYIPNHREMHRTVLYVKGDNGHYYLRTSFYSKRVFVFRLQKRNQINSSDDLGSLDCKIEYKGEYDDELVISQELLRQFVAAVNQHKPYRRRSRMRDSQRKKCYSWERKILNLPGCEILSRRVTRSQIQHLVKEICLGEGMKTPPKVQFRRDANCSWARGSSALSFSMRSLDDTSCLQTVLHELAHTLNYHRTRCEKEPGHGPSWVGIYIGFMVKLANVDRTQVENLAKEMGIKFHYENCLHLN